MAPREVVPNSQPQSFLHWGFLHTHHQFVTTPWHWSGLECRVDVKCSGSVPMTSAVETSGDRKGCERNGGEVRCPVSTGPRAVSLGPLPQKGQGEEVQRKEELLEVLHSGYYEKIRQLSKPHFLRRLKVLSTERHRVPLMSSTSNLQVPESKASTNLYHKVA